MIVLCFIIFFSLNKKVAIIGKWSEVTFAFISDATAITPFFHLLAITTKSIWSYLPLFHGGPTGTEVGLVYVMSFSSAFVCHVFAALAFVSFKKSMKSCLFSCISSPCTSSLVLSLSNVKRAYALF